MYPYMQFFLHSFLHVTSWRQWRHIDVMTSWWRHVWWRHFQWHHFWWRHFRWRHFRRAKKLHIGVRRSLLVSFWTPCKFFNTVMSIHVVVAVVSTLFFAHMQWKGIKYEKQAKPGLIKPSQAKPKGYLGGKSWLLSGICCDHTTIGHPSGQAKLSVFVYNNFNRLCDSSVILPTTYDQHLWVPWEQIRIQTCQTLCLSPSGELMNYHSCQHKCTI